MIFKKIVFLLFFLNLFTFTFFLHTQNILATETWSKTSLINAPEGRIFPSTVWTGKEMIVWGGHIKIIQGLIEIQKTGAAYNPTTDTWRNIAVVDTPAIITNIESTIWTGEEMIIWGKTYSKTNIGLAYNPTTDTWRNITTKDAPKNQGNYSSVWTGKEMIIWGGLNNNWRNLITGAAYNPTTNTWRNISTKNAPKARELHSAVWTGKEMIVWGGSSGIAQTMRRLNTGAAYNPTTDTWRNITNIWQIITTVPEARTYHSTIWTGKEMIIWGGISNSKITNTGAAYNPNTNTWRTITTKNAPEPRSNHSAIWTGKEMIIWGGTYRNSDDHLTGAAYNPTTDTWRNISTINTPTAQTDSSVVWTGEKMIVWGGLNYTNTGGILPISTSTIESNVGLNKEKNKCFLWWCW